MSAAPAPWVLAADLGATNLRAAAVAADGAIAARASAPTPPDDPGALAAMLAEVARGLGAPPAGAVVGVPAVVDYERGEPVRLPNLPRWQGAISARAVAAATGLPTLFANDADLAALGEHRGGAGRGAADMVYVTVSSGVGAGVVIGGRLLRARRSLAEAGHMTIDYRAAPSDGVAAADPRTVEGLGSGLALARRAGLDGAEAARRARAGDAEARRRFAELAEALAAGVASLAEAFMPERVVIGGGVTAGAGDLVLPPLREALARSPARGLLDPASVVPAALGDDAGLIGARALWDEYASPPPPAPPLRPFAP